MHASVSFDREQLDSILRLLSGMPESIELDSIRSLFVQALLQVEAARVWSATHERLERAMALLSSVSATPTSLSIAGQPIPLSGTLPPAFAEWSRLVSALLQVPLEFSITDRLRRLTEEISRLREINLDKTDWRAAFERSERELVAVHVILDRLGYQSHPSAANRLSGTAPGYMPSRFPRDPVGQLALAESLASVIYRASVKPVSLLGLGDDGVVMAAQISQRLLCAYGLSIPLHSDDASKGAVLAIADTFLIDGDSLIGRLRVVARNGHDLVLLVLDGVVPESIDFLPTMSRKTS